MKIKTQADVKALDKKIQSELGVDIGKYRDPDIVSTISDLLVFPIYALSWTIRPVIIAFLLFIAGFFFFDLVHIEYLLYAIFGIILFLTTGLLAGLLYLTIRFKSDIASIMNFSMDILKGIVQDVDKLNTTTDASNRKANLQLLFLGTVHLITIPVASDVIGNKVPFIGGLVARLVSKILMTVSNLFRLDKIVDAEAREETGGEGKILPMYLASVTGFHNITDKVLGIGVRVVQLPVFLIFAFFALVTWLFVWIIN